MKIYPKVGSNVGPIDGSKRSELASKLQAGKDQSPEETLLRVVGTDSEFEAEVGTQVQKKILVEGEAAGTLTVSITGTNSESFTVLTEQIEPVKGQVRSWIPVVFAPDTAKENFQATLVISGETERVEYPITAKSTAAEKPEVVNLTIGEIPVEGYWLSEEQAEALTNINALVDVQCIVRGKKLEFVTKIGYNDETGLAKFDATVQGWRIRLDNGVITYWDDSKFVPANINVVAGLVEQLIDDGGALYKRCLDLYLRGESPVLVVSGGESPNPVSGELVKSGDVYHLAYVGDASFNFVCWFTYPGTGATTTKLSKIVVTDDRVNGRTHVRTDIVQWNITR